MNAKNLIYRPKRCFESGRFSEALAAWSNSCVGPGVGVAVIDRGVIVSNDLENSTESRSATLRSSQHSRSFLKRTTR